MAKKKPRQKTTRSARTKKTAAASSSSAPPKQGPAYTDIIHATELHGVRFAVAKGDILEADRAKVLPTNEFFNLSDSDWESRIPKSVVGQYVKRLSDTDRKSLQKTIDRALNDPQVLFRNMVLKLKSPDGRSFKAAGNSVKFDSGNLTKHRFPPSLGQDSIEILTTLMGKSEDEVSRLIESGVVFTRKKTF